jgi:hypothetical protein
MDPAVNDGLTPDHGIFQINPIANLHIRSQTNPAVQTNRVPQGYSRGQIRIG